MGEPRPHRGALLRIGTFVVVCGIGVVVEVGGSGEVTLAIDRIDRMQAHRGPDDHGRWVGEVAPGVTVGLTNQRLAILDLSDAGHQPMVSSDGRYVLVYNGEIFNYKELAVELRDDPLLRRSSGDTAVVLAALAKWGTNALPRFNGMWALALLDRSTSTMLIARDRMGVKPLYAYQTDSSLILASEVKAIVEAVGQKFELNRNAIKRYLFQSLTDVDESTMFEQIRAFPTGAFRVFRFSESGITMDAPSKYWTHPFISGTAGTVEADHKEEVRETLIDATSIRLRSDVPVALLLSGGLDSSAILAAAKAAGMSDTLVAISAISEDRKTDERRFIDLMASHCGVRVEHVNVDANPTTLFRDLERTCWYNDQPVLSMSAVAHRRLMEEACGLGATVLLTGQGADEQLAGYSKFAYFYLYDSIRRRRFRVLARTLASGMRQRTLLPNFRPREAKRYSRRLVSRGSRDGSFEMGDWEPTYVGPAGSYEEREWLDVTSLSIPALLHYEDRMSMSWSREMRCPFMDVRLVELLAKINPDQKIRKGWTKAVLRASMEDLLPPEITWRRRKQGFTIPEESWAKTTLRKEFSTVLLDPSSLVCRLGLVDVSRSSRLFERFQAGDPLTGYKDVFNVVGLEFWLRSFEPYVAGL